MADGGGFKWNAKQLAAKAAIRLGRFYTLIVGGSRSGKTFLIVWCIIWRALREPNSKHCILRLRFNAAFATLWLDTIPKVVSLCLPQYRLVPHARDGYFEFPHNGSQIWIGGLDDKERVEKILGHEFATMFFNECSQIPYASILTALTRLAAKCEHIKPRAFFDINPPSEAHWTYKLWFKHVDPITNKPVDPNDYAHAFINPKDNIDNIDKNYLKLLEGMPPSHRKRFLDGVYAATVAGQLWTPELIDGQILEVGEALPFYSRVVVAIDPSGSKGDEDKRSDEIGIIVAGRTGGTKEGVAHVVEDLSGSFNPEKWGAIAVTAYERHKADAIVAEDNYGGDMVRAVVHSINPNVKYKSVTATRGKVVRAEPVSALYHAKRVYHLARFDELEAQMQNFTTNGYLGERSPDRADAMVWAITELMLTDSADPLIEFMRQQAQNQER